MVPVQIIGEIYVSKMEKLYKMKTDNFRERHKIYLCNVACKP